LFFRRSIPFLDRFFFGHVLALFGFAIVARPWLPILSASGIHPDVAGCNRSLRHAARRQLRKGRFRANVLFIRFDPIGSDRLLGCREVELSVANQLMKACLRAGLSPGHSKARFDETPARDF
jgi:hypothetical protein